MEADLVLSILNYFSKNRCKLGYHLIAIQIIYTERCVQQQDILCGARCVLIL